MLYKKNIEKALSDSLFKNPTSEYRGTPFWSWNCKMTPELLERQIEYLKEMGFGGFHMHSRHGMDNEYLGDDFMSLIRACTDKAKAEGMLAWLYDEDKWPSGFAGGLVTREPKFRQRQIVIVPPEMVRQISEYDEGAPNAENHLDVSDELSPKEAFEQGKPYYLATFDLCFDKDGYLVSYKKIGRKSRAKGIKRHVFCRCEPCTDWFNGYTYVDTLSKPATEKFIEITHETYKRCVGDEFDKTVPAMFTDEPQHTFVNTLISHDAKIALTAPWTFDLPKTYKKAYGEDIITTLPEIFWDLPNNKPSLARYRYHDHVCQRMSDAFMALCGKWCEKNGIKLTGHLMGEDTLYMQTWTVGEVMRNYKHFGIVGIDLLRNKIELTTAKQAQSVTRQYGKEAIVSEMYGITNWDFDFRDHKFQGDWQAALGVTVRVPHLSWVSMKGNAKRDYPASINYQSPWYKQYNYIEDHFARIHTAMTRGKPRCSVAMIHPIESYWLYWGTRETSWDKREKYGAYFEELIKWMLYGQIDFDYISEALFPEQTKVATSPLKVGKMSYDTVIVPPMVTMRRTTFERLRDFKAAGGRLIFVGECPRYIDVCESEELIALCDESEHVPFEKLPLLDALAEEREVEIRLSDHSQAPNYIYQMRDDGNRRWLFVANAIYEKVTDYTHAKNLHFKLKGYFDPKLYNTVSGSISEVACRYEDGFTRFSVPAYIHDSFLFALDKGKRKPREISAAALPPYRLIKTVDYKGRVPYKLEEPNVLLLDLAEFTWDDNQEFMPLEEIRRIDARVRQLANIPPKSGKQPWTLSDEEFESHTTTLKFTFMSDTEVSDARLALEDADVSRVCLDGIEVEMKVDGYFTDESIQTVKLPYIGVGEHVLTVTLPLSPRSYTEAYYLLGSFNVRLEGCDKTLTPPTQKIGFGAIMSQGLPFYTGNITYECEFEVDEDDSTVQFHANYYRGALISVKLDGNEVGKIVSAPYNLNATGVKKGWHVAHFTLYGNRYNCFAALHNTNTGTDQTHPSLWFSRDDAFAYNYQLKPMGIMTSPKILIFKR